MKTSIATVSQGPISIEVTPLQNYCSSFLVSPIPVVVDIRVAESTQNLQKKKESPPFDLVFCLDRSGSMEGDRIEFCKQAISLVLQEHIRENIDRVGLVVYDDKIETIFDLQFVTRSVIKELIQKLQCVDARGSTDLNGGLLSACSLITKNESKSESIRQKKVFLFSDGQLNHGVTHKPTILNSVQQIYSNNSIAISTFGVGADYDEEIMKGIATSGSGFFFHLGNVDEIPKYVNKAMRQLISVVGVESTIKFRGLNGTIIQKIGTESSQEILLKGSPLKELKEKDLKRLIVRVEIRPPSTSSVDSLEFLSFDLQFKNEQGEPQQIKGSCKMNFTEDEETVLRDGNINKLADAAVKLASCAEIDKQVLELLEKNKIEEATALKTTVVDMLQSVQEHDTIAGAMLKKATETLQTIKSRNIAESKKAVHWEAYVAEEDCDMGYGLFD